MSTAPLLARIAVAVDLAPGSRRLLAHGLRLALDSGAQLVVVHAERPGEPRPWHVDQVLSELCRAWDREPVQAIEVHTQGEHFPTGRQLAHQSSAGHHELNRIIKIQHATKTGRCNFTYTVPN